MSRASVGTHLTALDWQSVSTDRMRLLYAAESQRWSSILEWDTAQAWPEIERGRLLGTVSGLVVVDDDDRVAGWSYYLVQRTALQVGGFVADSESAAQLMVDRILNAGVLDAVSTVTLFAFADAPGLAGALRARGLSVDRYWYLGRDLERRPPIRTTDVRPWRPDDVKATAELLARSYEPTDEARPFAPRGTLEAWTDYVAQLTGGPGCGTLLRDASFAIAGGPGRLLGVALVTQLSSGTSHLAQLAVDPQHRGRRVGAGLVELACLASAQAGYRRLTLLVSGRNSRARSLYDLLRFETLASFLAAGTLHPRRSTSVAPGVAAVTRR
jgi:ribosomal protein S18 acetylase RimI-like enzyme